MEPQRKRQVLESNREENEELIENLMNRIVAKPNFGADANMQKKIDKILKVKSFQKMVENADLLQDISNNSTLFNQSEFL